MPWQYRNLEIVYELWLTDDSPDSATQRAVLLWLMALMDDPDPPESTHAGPGFPAGARMAEVPGTTVCFLYEIVDEAHELWAAWLNTL